jgi:hypothetical protein
MFNDRSVIFKSNPVHTLIIVMHCKAIHGRGVLLLNVSETESRIKHLEGFVSVSFFVNETGETIGEYVQWRTPEHLADAGRRPEFFEHIRVLHGLVSAEVSGYEVERVITQEEVTIGPTFQGVVDMQILRLPKENAEQAINRVEEWAERAPGRSSSLRTVVVHVDRQNAKIALFIHHAGARLESVWYHHAETPEVTRAVQMSRYATVAAPTLLGRPMQYVMTPPASGSDEHTSAGEG